MNKSASCSDFRSIKEVDLSIRDGSKSSDQPTFTPDLLISTWKEPDEDEYEINLIFLKEDQDEDEDEDEDYEYNEEEDDDEDEDDDDEDEDDVEWDILSCMLLMYFEKFWPTNNDTTICTLPLNFLQNDKYNSENKTWLTIAIACNRLKESLDEKQLINQYYSFLPEHVKLFLSENKSATISDTEFNKEINNIISFINCQMKKNEARGFKPITTLTI